MTTTHSIAAVLATLSLLLAGVTSPWAFEIDAHREMTLQALDAPAQSITSVLQRLGNDDVGGSDVKATRDLVATGSEREDYYSTVLGLDIAFDGTRVRRHFHDPLTNLGLRGYGQSAVDYAQVRWRMALDALELGLAAENAREREEFFDFMFDSLGRVMHLLQDSAAASHTRDDSHCHPCRITLPVVGTLFVRPETRYASDHFPNAAMVRSYLTEGGIVPPPASLLQSASELGRPSAISNLWDTDSYGQQSPCGSVSPAAAGLAELSAAHAFSDDTLFVRENGGGRFPCPAEPDPKTCTRDPKSPSGRDYEVCEWQDGGIRVSVAKSWRPGPAASRYVYGIPSALLANRQLIPRAVGYSTALWNYFFRPVPLRFTYEKATMVVVEEGDEVEPGTLTIYNDSDEALAGGDVIVFAEEKPGEMQPFYLLEDVAIPPKSRIQREVVQGIFNRSTGPRAHVRLIYRGPIGVEAHGIAWADCDCSSPDAACGDVCDGCGNAVVDTDEDNSETCDVYSPNVRAQCHTTGVCDNQCQCQYNCFNAILEPGEGCESREVVDDRSVSIVTYPGSTCPLGYECVLCGGCRPCPLAYDNCYGRSTPDAPSLTMERDSSHSSARPGPTSSLQPNPHW